MMPRRISSTIAGTASRNTLTLSGASKATTETIATAVNETMWGTFLAVPQAKWADRYVSKSVVAGRSVHRFGDFVSPIGQSQPEFGSCILYYIVHFADTRSLARTGSRRGGRCELVREMAST